MPLAETKLKYQQSTDNEMSSHQFFRQYHRYHVIIAKVPCKGLWMQDFVCCDYFRTPVIFEGSDI